MNHSIPQRQLQVGGTLNPRKHVFVSRLDLEDELLEMLKRGEYCNLLSSRQVGKSSIMSQTAIRLQQLGIRVATIDVSGELGTPTMAAEWYVGFLTTVARSLRIELDVKAWWEQQQGTPNQRLLDFFRSQLFVSEASPVVLFVDEIDFTLKLPFTDDFFTAIRSMYNQRGNEPAYEKIAFCLIGVATPNELVKDRRTTSYNVGQTFEVRDFDLQRDDLSAVAALLADDPSVAADLLRQVLHWTGGHPYLTLWLCQEIRNNEIASSGVVDMLVRETFANYSRIQSDVHFQQITRFLGERVTDQLAFYQMYDRILRGKRERDTAGQTHIDLKLAGIVKRDPDGNLVVRNPIYRHIFDRQWVRQSKPQRKLRRMAQFAFAATMLLAIIGTWTAYDRVVLEPARAQRAFAQGLVQAYLAAEISEVPELIEQVRQRRQATVSLLLAHSRSENPRWRLRANLALLAADDDRAATADYLWQRLLIDTSEDGPVIGRVLERYAADDPGSLTARIVTGNVDDFRAFVPRLAQNPDRGKQALRKAIAILSQAIDDTTGPSPVELHRRRADAAIALWRLADPEQATEILKVDKDPESLTQFVHRCKERGIQAADLWEELQSAADTTVRYGLLLALGEFDRTEIPDERRAQWVEQVAEWYAKDPKSAIHSAAGWALRQWNVELPDIRRCETQLAREQWTENRSWFRNSLGMTMIQIPGGTYRIGSEEAEDNNPIRDVTESEFWLSACEVTVAEFLKLLPDVKTPQIVRDAETPSGRLKPLSYVTWFDAVRFCNRLSEKEGLEPCYEIQTVEGDEDNSITGLVTVKIARGNGYRLPTELQWEIACRAGTSTDYSFGSDEGWLSDYGWYARNAEISAHPVAEKRPNPWGLFDMHGNVWEWCHDLDRSFSFSFGSSRVSRGGGWLTPARSARSAYRNRPAPSLRFGDLGFRLALSPLGQQAERPAR